MAFQVFNIFTFSASLEKKIVSTFITFFTDFSFTKWLEGNNLVKGDPLDLDVRNKLLAELGLKDFLLDGQCSYTTLLDQVDETGWISGNMPILFYLT